MVLMKSIAWGALILSTAFVVAGCTQSTQPPSGTLATAVTPSTRVSTSTTQPPPPSTAPPGPAPHRIGIRGTGATAEFFDRETGAPFIVVGPNFHLLGPEHDYFVDRLFSPDHYDPARVDEELAAMVDLGYTVVRTSLDLCDEDCIGAPGGGLRDPYLDNVADFLRHVRQHGLFVILTSNDLPSKAGYIPRVEATCCDPFDGYLNSHVLSPVGVAEWSRYWSDVLRALIERHAPLEAVLAYELRGELFLSSDQPPLSLTSGVVTTANGAEYDLANPTQRLAMVDDGVRYWVDTVAATIRGLDPTALITVGIFPPNTPNELRPGDDRLVPTVSAFAGSSIDFLDLHAYPGSLPLADLMENFGVNDTTALPRIMAEFGGFTFVFGSPEEAAAGIEEWQVESCRYGLIGWMFWHWTGTADHEVWTGSEGSGVIRTVLAPANRPDPCRFVDFPFFPRDLAHEKPVRASHSLPEGRPGAAVDGWRSTAWQSGDGPPQWIEVDLEQEATIEEILLVPSQFPAGETRHRILVAGPDHAFRSLGEIEGKTADGDELRFRPAEPVSGVRFVRVETRSSPSWVSWREVKVLGTPEG
ncbi:F5/8 type C domain protein [bacterium BMS3Abin02]|nr:F5/8 type C domain protein [bacterium BMS3Abin02]